MIDKAVRRVKSLPRNRNCSAPSVVYRCSVCRKFSTDDLTEAWWHSLTHGPWPVDSGGTLTNLDGLPNMRSLLYNRGSGESSLIRRVV